MSNTPRVGATLILHQYDISPFSQKAQKMMGLKGASWTSVEMPLIAPKPDVEALTGGYRGTPVLQIGADVYIDNWMIARALDKHRPGRPINAKDPLDAAALYAWGERFFTPLLHSALATYKDQWDADFLADRQRVFPEVNIGALSVQDPDRRSQVRAFLGAIANRLDAAGPYAGGAQADSWDIHLWGMLWMIHSALPDLLPLVSGFPQVVGWYERMLAMGTGERSDAGIEVAWQALAETPPQALPETPGDEPLRDWLDLEVLVSTGSADRGAASGRLLAIDHEQAVIAVTPRPGSPAQVWFPRLGYHLSPAD